MSTAKRCRRRRDVDGERDQQRKRQTAREADGEKSTARDVDDENGQSVDHW
jgi:hypothetical protein